MQIFPTFFFFFWHFTSGKRCQTLGLNVISIHMQGRPDWYVGWPLRPHWIWDEDWPLRDVCRDERGKTQHAQYTNGWHILCTGLQQDWGGEDLIPCSRGHICMSRPWWIFWIKKKKKCIFKVALMHCENPNWASNVTGFPTKEYKVFFSYLIKATVLLLESCKQKKGRDNQTGGADVFWRANKIKCQSGDGDAETRQDFPFRECSDFVWERKSSPELVR